MIYTSYFQKLNMLKRNGIIPISICAKPPDNYNGITYKNLAPSFALLSSWHKTHNVKEYIEIFEQQVLNKLNAEKVYDDICKLAGKNNDVTLLCYENPIDFCHRHLVAQWFNKNGISCEEWNPHKHK